MIGQLFTNPAYKGLLADEDQQTLKKQAMLNAGLSLLANSQGGQPGTGRAALFPALLQGLQAGQQAYTSGAEGILKNQQIKQQRDVMAQRKQLLGGLTGAPNAVQSALAGGGGPTVVNAEKMQGVQGNNLARMMDAYREALLLDDGGKTAEQIKKLIDLEKPQFKTQSVQELMVEGKPKKFAIGEDGTMRELGVSPEDLIQIDAGGQKLLVGKNTGQKIAEFGVTMTPDAKASNAVAWANVNLRKQELEKPQIMDTAEGLISVNPRTLQTRPIVGSTGAPIPGKQKDLPEGVMNAQGFADRMQNAESILKTKPAPGTAAILARGVPFAGNVLGNLANSPEQQQYYQAAQDWIRAKLRKESGAAIGVDEMAQEYATYFPQIGDSQDVIKQKELAREQATLGMIRAGGNTYKPNLVSQKEAQKKNEQPKTFDRLPDPAQFNGKVMESDAGIRYRSNGKTWVREMK